jgi:hypothetical protein
MAWPRDTARRLGGVAQPGAQRSDLPSSLKRPRSGVGRVEPASRDSSFVLSRPQVPGEGTFPEVRAPCGLPIARRSDALLEPSAFARIGCFSVRPRRHRAGDLGQSSRVSDRQAGSDFVVEAAKNSMIGPMTWFGCSHNPPWPHPAISVKRARGIAEASSRPSDAGTNTSNSKLTTRHGTWMPASALRGLADRA